MPDRSLCLKQRLEFCGNRVSTLEGRFGGGRRQTVTHPDTARRGARCLGAERWPAGKVVGGVLRVLPVQLLVLVVPAQECGPELLCVSC